jgi:hypothetical protein
MLLKYPVTSSNNTFTMKSTSLPLVSLVVLLAVSLPGSTADPVGTCPAVDGAIPVYLPDSVSCEYV